jgi:dienelactone hydrolase
MRLSAIGLLLICVTALFAPAAVVMQPVDYSQGGVQLEGWIVYDDAIQQPRPGIVVFPEWWGLNDYAKNRARQLAQLGYVAFAADMYGKGVVTTDKDQAPKLSAPFYNDRGLMRDRAAAALDQLIKDPHVDPKRVAAIGYCFGGSVALELARSGADLACVVAFHAGLATPHPEDARNIKGKILVCTGGDDAFVPPDQVNAFEDEMRAAGVDWEVIAFGGAHHAFTNPNAGQYGIPNIKYSPEADRRSWAAMKEMFDEVFPGQSSPNNN